MAACEKRSFETKEEETTCLKEKKSELEKKAHTKEGDEWRQRIETEPNPFF